MKTMFAFLQGNTVPKLIEKAEPIGFDELYANADLLHDCEKKDDRSVNVPNSKLSNEVIVKFPDSAVRDIAA